MFYEKLTELCNKKGMSVARLAKELNLSNATATKWKHGVTPRYNTLYQIAQFFDVDIEFLADDQYLDYDEWLSQVKGMARAEVIRPTWTKDYVAEPKAEPGLDEDFLAMARRLTPSQMQRVKDFMRGVLS